MGIPWNIEANFVPTELWGNIPIFWKVTEDIGRIASAFWVVLVLVLALATLLCIITKDEVGALDSFFLGITHSNFLLNHISLSNKSIWRWSCVKLTRYTRYKISVPNPHIVSKMWRMSIPNTAFFLLVLLVPALNIEIWYGSGSLLCSVVIKIRQVINIFKI